MKLAITIACETGNFFMNEYAKVEIITATISQDIISILSLSV
jgi:hypothetical protein